MQQTGVINDIVPDVLDALQGRTDIPNAMMARHIVRAARELSESYPFYELQTTGPTVGLTIGQSTYGIAQFLNTGDDYSMPESWAIFIDFPTNTVTAAIRYKTPAAIETIIASAVQGIPAWYSRFDTNFMFGPVPNQPYSVYLRYQNKHPFSPIPQLTDPLYITSSWFDILAYSAAMRICIPKRWTDQRKELHDMLYGDPEFQNSQGLRGRSGLVAARMFQQEREEKYNSRSVGLVVSRSNPR